LRERGLDILLLAQFFLRQFTVRLGKHISGLSPAAQSALLAHSWPGNVRELRNVMERAVILENTDQIRPASLPDFEIESRLRNGELSAPVPGRAAPSAVPSLPVSLSDALVQYERDLILAALQRCAGNLSKAAQQLDLSRHALRYRMSRLELKSDGVVDDES
jgi:DNA-binding NtrC family response regulator